MIFVLALLISIQSFAASSSSLIVHWDSRHMPITFEIVGPSREKFQFDIQRVSRDHYKRNLTAIKRTSFGEQSQIVLLNEPFEKFLDVELNAEIQKSLHWLAMSANEVPTEESPEIYLEKYPIYNFDLNTNRTLSEKYGVSFVADLYKKWTLKDPKTSDFKNLILSQIERPSAWSEETLLKLSKVQFLLVSGTGVGKADRPSVINSTTEGKFFRDLTNLGLNTTAIDVAPFGLLDLNSQLIANHLKIILRRSKDPVVILAMSRGVAEVLGALRSLPATLTENRILALYNFSGLAYGSLVADWFSSNPLLFWFKPFSDLNHTNITRRLNRAIETLQPFPIIYNVYGVPSLFGFAKDNNMRNLQNLLIRPFLGHYGLNDGIIETPECILPRALGLSSFDLQLDSSHVLLDGTIGNFNLKDPSTRKSFVRALIQSLIDQSEYFRTQSP